MPLDGGLMSVLDQQPNMDALRTLYVYESQMGLLIRLSTSQRGAQLLLECNVFQRLSEMSVFSQRPEVLPNMADNATFIPDTTQRFHQILFPSLQLCATILTTLGGKNRMGSSEVCLLLTCSLSFLIVKWFSFLPYFQVVHFLLSHSETISAILRNRSLVAVPVHLEEIALLTGVVSRAAGWDFVQDESPAALEIRGQLNRLEQVTLNLLPVYVPGGYWFAYSLFW